MDTATKDPGSKEEDRSENGGTEPGYCVEDTTKLGLGLTRNGELEHDVNKNKPDLDKATTSATNSKRTDFIAWPDYFMAVAFLSAQRSKDPSTQVGACIVNSENKIVGIGYNGMPIGCSDDEMPWSREGDSILDTKHAFGEV